MRYLLLLAVAACDLKPAPREKTPVPAPQVAADAAALPQDPFADASLHPPDVLMEVTQPCMDVGVRIADVMISTTIDPSQRAALEQDRVKLVRRTAETCTRDAWPDAARQCFLRATSQVQLQECGKNLAAP
jgi:hypothetical protein